MTLDDTPPVPEPATVPPLPIDWAAAGAVAARAVRPGPTASPDELAALVASLRAAAEAAAGHVVDLTQLVPADGRGIADVPLARVYVVDRSTWARANTEVFAGLVPGGAEGGAATRAAGLAGAAQIGAVLAVLASRVLGQLDPFSRPYEPRGRLLLVAPNVLHIERELALEPEDFRLWVALHEQTHAAQFAGAPWLADHLRARAARLLILAKGSDDDGDRSAHRDSEGEEAAGSPSTLAELAERVVAVVTDAWSDRGGDLASSGALAGVLGTEQRAIVEEVSALMAVLEGHADVTMDAVGPGVVPTVADIRRRFDARRAKSGSPFQRVLRRLLGLDAKLAQYREGAQFVRQVHAEVGTEGFNAVFGSPDALPSLAEIGDPRSWVRRVHG